MSYINQKPTKTITGNYTTTDSDNGYRIICNSETDFTITLHSPIGRYNFELEIDNIGAGKVTIEGKILLQNTHAHIGNDNGSSWVVSLGGGSGYELTKAKIEEVFTGEIDTHSHPFDDNVLKGVIAPTTSTVGTIGQFYLDTVVPKLYQCTSINEGVYTWTEVGSGGIAEIPQATETVLGGIKAAEKTSGETQEVKIDTTTGKLYSTPPTAAQNGLPAGGTAGQILSKIDGTDYNSQWIDAPSGGGGGAVDMEAYTYLQVRNARWI